VAFAFAQAFSQLRRAASAQRACAQQQALSAL